MPGRNWKPSHWTALVSLLVICGAGCKKQSADGWTPNEHLAALGSKQQQQVRDLLTKYAGTHSSPRLMGSVDVGSERLLRGQAIYEQLCAQCHGVTGDGFGPAAQYLSPLPRDYRPGIFKFTSTPYGSKPRRSDLLRILRQGVPGTAMPSFALLPEEELQEVVDYVLALTMRGELELRLVDDAETAGELDLEAVPDYVTFIAEKWLEAEKQTVMPISPMPDFTPESIETGRQAFLKLECSKCHGTDGRGGSLGNVEIGKDSWGHKTAAADLTSGMFRGGGRPIDIYRRIHSGINGTPMPSFGTAFASEPDKLWHVVHYIKSLGDQRRNSLPTLESMWKKEPANDRPEKNAEAIPDALAAPEAK